jgi:hypothetical protein
MHASGQIATAALKAGANGYLTKDSESDLLINAIRRVASVSIVHFAGRQNFRDRVEVTEIASTSGPPHHLSFDRKVLLRSWCRCEFIRTTVTPGANEFAPTSELSPRAASWNSPPAPFFKVIGGEARPLRLQIPRRSSVECPRRLMGFLTVNLDSLIKPSTR